MYGLGCTTLRNAENGAIDLIRGIAAILLIIATAFDGNAFAVLAGVFPRFLARGQSQVDLDGFAEVAHVFVDGPFLLSNRVSRLGLGHQSGETGLAVVLVLIILAGGGGGHQLPAEGIIRVVLDGGEPQPLDLCTKIAFDDGFAVEIVGGEDVAPVEIRALTKPSKSEQRPLGEIAGRAGLRVVGAGHIIPPILIPVVY